MTTPLLEGTDAKMENGVVVGAKMSKSADNYIGITEPPLVMLRKVMQIDDDVIFRYFELLSAQSNEEIAELKRREKATGATRRRSRRSSRARSITRFHDAEAAASAAPPSSRASTPSDAIPDDVAGVTLTTEGPTLWIAKALSSAGLVKSTGEGKRLVEQGGVEVDQASVIDDRNLQLERASVPPPRRLEEPPLRQHHRRSDNVSPSRTTRTPQQMW